MKQKIIYIALTITIATTLVLVLFFTSEHLMKKENPFTRRFLPHPLIDFKNSELAYNSYYITGFKNKKIYLGNTSAPLHGLVINTDGIIQDTINLKMETFRDYPFSSIKWNLLNDTILLNDYTIGMFLKSDLKIKSVKVVGKYDSIPFSIVIPYDTNKYILRTYNENQNNVNLSLLDIQKNNFKRFDGILDEEAVSK